MEVTKLNINDPNVIELSPEKVFNMMYAYDLLQPDEENLFKPAYEAGKQFKYAGLQPVFFFNAQNASIFVTTKERIEKKLH